GGRDADGGRRAVAGGQRPGRIVAASARADRGGDVGGAPGLAGAGTVLAAQPRHRLRAGLDAAGLWPEPAASGRFWRPEPAGLSAYLLLPAAGAAARQGAVAGRGRSASVPAARPAVAGASADPYGAAHRAGRGRPAGRGIALAYGRGAERS